MTTKVGLWIDHQNAIVVLLGNDHEETKQFHVADPETGATTHRERHAHAYTPNDFVSEDKRQRKVDALREAMYDEVLACMRDADGVLIVGPGEAKVEFRKHLERRKIPGIVVELETADKMSDRQLVALVSEHFSHAAP